MAGPGPGPVKNAPVAVPGGYPVIAVPGHTPTSPVTWVVVPVTMGALVTVEPAKIPKVQAAPNPEGGGSKTHGAEVVKLHVKLAAR